MEKIKALFTTASGLSLVLMFVVGGLSSLQAHGVANLSGLIMAVSFIGSLFHPTNMVGGSSIRRLR